MMSPLLVALMLAQASSAQSPLVIESDSSCPSARAVLDALVGLKPIESWPIATVSIAAQEQSLLVSLGSPATSQRRVTVEPDCGARASTAALVIATWLSELPTEAVAEPILGSRAPLARAEVSNPPAAHVRATQPIYRREVGAGLLAETGSGLSPGGRLEMLGLMGQGTFGWQTSVVWPAERDVTVGPGRTSYRRTSASVSLLGRLLARRLILSVDGGAAVAYTRAAGRDYQENQADQSLTYGLVAGLRGGVAWGRVRLWVDARLFNWLYRQRVEVQGVASTAALPSRDMQWAIGASYAL